MKHKDRNNTQGVGYPPQGGFGQPVQTGYPGYNPAEGYPSGQGYSPPQSYQAPQGYPSSQGYQSAPGYQASRSYQTPQVTGGQPPVTNTQEPAAVPYPGQGSYPRNTYPQQPAGYPGNTGYTPQAGIPQMNQGMSGQGYPYSGGQPYSGGYIPQTPYNQGYAAPGYQSPSGYPQGYDAYGQMGRSTQPQMIPPQEMSGQVPLNGGGYVPQPVPVRKQPFVMTDAYLLILSAVLLILFALGMFAPGLGVLKWAFLILSAASIAILWIKPLTENNKRLCFTIVFALLCLVTIIAFATGTSGGTTGGQPGGNPSVQTDAPQGQIEGNPETAAVNATEPPAATDTPEPDNSAVVRLITFFSYWSANKQEDMLTLCAPSWQSTVESPRTALFGLIGTRTPKEFLAENISGTDYDTSRTVTVNTLIDRNNGKPAVRYRLNVIMVKEGDGLWYVNPESLQSLDPAETTDPNVTVTPSPSPTPEVYSNTILYYNPKGGKYYHRDPNCKNIAPKYLPLQGHFTFAELANEPYKSLKPCAICGAPSADD